MLPGCIWLYFGLRLLQAIGRFQDCSQTQALQVGPCLESSRSVSSLRFALCLMVFALSSLCTFAGPLPGCAEGRGDCRHFTGNLQSRSIRAVSRWPREVDIEESIRSLGAQEPFTLPQRTHNFFTHLQDLLEAGALGVETPKKDKKSRGDSRILSAYPREAQCPTLHRSWGKQSLRVNFQATNLRGFCLRPEKSSQQLCNNSLVLKTVCLL